MFPERCLSCPSQTLVHPETSYGETSTSSGPQDAVGGGVPSQHVSHLDEVFFWGVNGKLVSRCSRFTVYLPTFHLNSWYLVNVGKYSSPMDLVGVPPVKFRVCILSSWKIRVNPAFSLEVNSTWVVAVIGSLLLMVQKSCISYSHQKPKLFMVQFFWQTHQLRLVYPMIYKVSKTSPSGFLAG